jgi:hypothetical protein
MMRLAFVLTFAAVLAGASPAVAQQQPAPAPDQGNGNWDPPPVKANYPALTAAEVSHPSSTLPRVPPHRRAPACEPRRERG